MNKESKRTIIDMSMFGDKSTQANLAYLDNVYSRIVVFGEKTDKGITGSAYTMGRNDIEMNLFDEALFSIANSTSNGDEMLVIHCYNTLCKLKKVDKLIDWIQGCLIAWLNEHGVAQEDIGSEP